MHSERPSVLVVDDSTLVRQVIIDILTASAEFRVAGEAVDGIDAIRKVHALRPDLVTLDVQMPQLDGLQTLGYIMSEAARPVVMLTALEAPGGGDLTMRALELGAVDFVHKPGRDDALDAGSLRERLLTALRGAVAVNLAATGVLARPAAARRRATAAARPARSVVAIAASTGGPRALAELVPMLPPDLGAAVLVVQHMPAGFTGSLAHRLDRVSALPVTEAQHGELVLANRIYVAPGGRHLAVSSGVDDARFAIRDDPPVQGVRPSADVLFASIARVFGPSAVGVVLTGMGRDGAHGLREMRLAGAFAVVQDQATSIVYGMPRAALQVAGAESVAALAGMADAIVTGLATRRGADVTPAPLPRS